MPSPTAIKERLQEQNIPLDKVNKFVGYVYDSLASEKNSRSSHKPVTSNTDDQLVSMFLKWHSLGLTVDGTYVVIAGRGMAMPTYHGYKLKVSRAHPSAKFDVQLIRGEDKFSVSKKNGRVYYTHDIDNPFGEEAIKGAYCVINIDDKDYFEALNKRDYDLMRAESKQSRLWDQWDSEFWLKSVIKRACKRHFFDEIKDIDEADNDQFGLRPENEPPQALEQRINEADTAEQLREVYRDLDPKEQSQVAEMVMKKIEKLTGKKDEAEKNEEPKQDTAETTSE